MTLVLVAEQIELQITMQFCRQLWSVCLFHWSPLWLDNDTLSCNERYRWTKKHFTLHVHQQLSLHGYACWWTVTFCLNKYGFTKVLKKHPDHSSSLMTAYTKDFQHVKCVVIFTPQATIVVSSSKCFPKQGRGLVKILLINVYG